MVSDPPRRVACLVGNLGLAEHLAAKVARLSRPRRRVERPAARRTEEEFEDPVVNGARDAHVEVIDELIRDRTR